MPRSGALLSPGPAAKGGGTLSRALMIVALLSLLSGNLYRAHPHYNWDLLPYVAVAYRLGGDAPEEAHRRAYGAARAAIPADRFDVLTRSDVYRQTMADDPGAFQQQLSFYSVKPAYPLLILALERLGANPVRASILVSRAAYVAVGLVLLLWLSSFLAPAAAVVSAWATMSLPFALDLARFSSPDAVSTLLVLTALWLVFQAGRFPAGALLLVLSLLVRPDNLLWVLAVAAFGAVRMDRARMAVAFSGAAALLYVGLATLSGHPGWATLFHHSFVERLTHPETFEPSLSPLGYLRIYLRESHPVNLPPFLALFGLLGAWLFRSRLREHGWSDRWVGFLAVAGGFAVLHWLLYPDGDRFLVAAYGGIVVLLLRTLAGGGGRQRATATPGLVTSRNATTVALCLLLASCDSPTGPPLAVTSASVEAVGPLVRELSVTLDEPAPLEVEYWTEDGPRLRVTSPSAATHGVLLSRLRPGRTYSYEIVRASHSGTFETGDLPPALAAIGFSVLEGSPTAPLTLLHLSAENGFSGYAIVDPDGEVVWFRETEDFPFGMTRRANGNFVFMVRNWGLREVTPAGEVVAVLDDGPDRETHHDVVATPDNTLLFLAFDVRTVEDGSEVKGEAIWEWTPETGSVVKRWSSWDHLSVTEDRGPRFETEWLHANSLAVGPRGNVLVSLHYLNQVVSVAPDWQSLEWRLGGVNPTIQVDAADQFSGQHTAREISPGRVVLFDNGLDREGFSRAVEFDLSGSIATKVWEWGDEASNRSTAVSSARRLPNGNTLVGFGMGEGVFGASGPTEVYEVDPSGEVRWHLLVDGVEVIFRAEPLGSVAGEEVG